MCGIFAILNQTSIADKQLQNFSKGNNRGPEYSELNVFSKNVVMGFHRLAINGLTEQSNMPMRIKNCILICNGEIYNFKQIYDMLGYEGETCNDCEVIIHLYKEVGFEQMLQLLDGVFAFVLLDNESNSLYVARDCLGVRPLFQNRYNGKFTFSSELKMMNCPKYPKVFQPGTFVYYKKYAQQSWHEVLRKSFARFNSQIDYQMTEDEALRNIRNSFIKAIKKRITTTNRPIACLLSGGLDSSLVTALVNKYYGSPLETYSIGLEGSEDLKYARIVAKYLKTQHTEIIVTEMDFLDSIPETIQKIESYDTTTVRASVGNYLVSKYISQHSKAKVIFNGDGSDELCGGYMYFHCAPNSVEFDKECRRLLKNIHFFDVLRSDRSIASNGLEPRTPFLDKSFVETYLSIPPNIRNHSLKKNIEKYLLRTAFEKDKLLPKEILFRKKEAFSDGVSSLEKSWYTIIQSHIQNDYAIQELIKTIDGDLTDEQKYYKCIFLKLYPNCERTIPYYWMPRFVKATDSSARTLSVYKKI